MAALPPPPPPPPTSEGAAGAELRLFGMSRLGNLTIVEPEGYNGTWVEGYESLDFADFISQQVVMNNIAVAALTLFGWEFLTTLPSEIALYRHRRLLSPPVILFAFVRYSTVAAVVLPAYSIFNDFTDNPEGCLDHMQLTIVPVQTAVGCVFAWRTIAIWRGNPRIKYFLWALMLAQFGASFGLLWHSQEKLLPNGACMPVAGTGPGNTLPWFYLVAFVFDLITVGLSLFKLVQISNSGHPLESQLQAKDAFLRPMQFAKRVVNHWRTLTPLVERLLASGLIYLFVASAFNLLNFALELHNYIYAKALIPLYAPLMAILGQRIVLMEVQAVYGSGRKSTGSRERGLVDRVMRDGRLSWEGEDEDTPRRALTNSGPSSSGLGANALREKSSHVVLPMHTHPTDSTSPDTVGRRDSDSDTSQAGGLSLAGMLSSQPTDEDARPRASPKTLRSTLRGLKRVTSAQRSEPDAAHASATKLDVQHLQLATEPDGLPSLQPRPPPVLDAQARALAVRMAGLEPSAPPVGAIRVADAGQVPINDNGL